MASWAAYEQHTINPWRIPANLKNKSLGITHSPGGIISHLRSLPSSLPPPSSAFPAAALCTVVPHQRPWTRTQHVSHQLLGNWLELLAFYHWTTTIKMLHPVRCSSAIRKLLEFQSNRFNSSNCPLFNFVWYHQKCLYLVVLQLNIT